MGYRSPSTVYEERGFCRTSLHCMLAENAACIFFTSAYDILQTSGVTIDLLKKVFPRLSTLDQRILERVAIEGL